MTTDFANTEAQERSGEQVNFSFGKNWEKFLENINEERIALAQGSLRAFTGMERFDGLTFLDAGSGSGLFSLAAYRMGAASVTSIDVDPHSVRCAEVLRQREGMPANWQIMTASILSNPFSGKKFDIVYSWGVVHHTGAMWDAVSVLCDYVREGGILYLAIYRETRFSRQWLSVKRIYNKQGLLTKKVMVFGYALGSIIWQLLRGENPMRHILTYKEKSRGMSWIRDIEDWLGGLPYEYARPEVVKQFVEQRRFSLVRQEGMEYLFLKMKQGGK
jgi:2-polyprenyl-6-hydroxyphenyl methylase/3-demethylubiquinone-9 3-methyltransferase